MGLWHDLRALDQVEARLRDYRAAVDEGAAAYGDVTDFADAFTSSHVQHNTYEDTTGTWHEYVSVSEPISTGAADSAVRDWDEPFAEDVPLVDYAGEDTVAEALVREFVDESAATWADEPFADDDEPFVPVHTEWYDMGTCQGCGAYGRVGLIHYRFMAIEGGMSECGEYM